MNGIHADPTRLVIGDQIEFFDAGNLPEEFDGCFKIRGAWDVNRKDENGKEIDAPYLGCDRLYTLVREDNNQRFIYKTNERAPDTIQQNSYSKSKAYTFSSGYTVKVITHGATLLRRRSSGLS